MMRTKRTSLSRTRAAKTAARKAKEREATRTAASKRMKILAMRTPTWMTGSTRTSLKLSKRKLAGSI
jgi:hypothetical protein